MHTDIYKLSEHLGQMLKARHWRVATAESCSGGGVAAAITSVPGSSDWFEYGLVSYANSAKQKLLGVKAETLLRQGSVSAQTVAEMAQGCISLSGANLAVAISGVAGPSGGSLDKPVGTVWFAWLIVGQSPNLECHFFNGTRQEIQSQAVKCALEGLIRQLEKNTV